jgi:hypothetical protein
MLGESVMARMNWDRVNTEARVRASFDYSALMDHLHEPALGAPSDDGRRSRSKQTGGRRTASRAGTPSAKLADWARRWADAHGATPAQRDAFLRDLRATSDLANFSKRDIRPFLSQVKTVDELVALARPFRKARLAANQKRSTSQPVKASPQSSTSPAAKKTTRPGRPSRNVVVSKTGRTAGRGIRDLHPPPASRPDVATDGRRPTTRSAAKNTGRRRGRKSLSRPTMPMPTCGACGRPISVNGFCGCS